jgi:UDP-N-acetylmuramoylalanine--D-glutamate ligase
MSSDDCFIFCSDDEITINHLNKIIVQAQKLPFTQKKEVNPGAFVQDDRIIVRYKEDECDMFLQELALGGKHNVYNSMAAALAAKAMDTYGGQEFRDALAAHGMANNVTMLRFLAKVGRALSGDSFVHGSKPQTAPDRGSVLYPDMAH